MSWPCATSHHTDMLSKLFCTIPTPAQQSQCSNQMQTVFLVPISSLSATSWESDDPMEDVWHGSVWREFPNADDGSGIYTSHSGNLVFSLYLDWFNSEGNSSHGKHNSVGAIVLICLNLPPTQRYKVENVFLFGIIPGPREPSLDEVNHLLQPLIDELKEFWTGIFFASTSQHPQGRTIRAAIFPLIADLPALRKVGGFGSHSSIRFCSFCTLSKHNLEEIDKSNFHPQTNDEHLKQANAWLQHENATSRKKFVKQHGARWSVLNELPYWKPIEFCSIELMHALILGNLKDHTMRFMSLVSSASKLKEAQDKEREWQNDQSHTEHPFTLKPGPPDKGKRKLADRDDENTTSDEPTKRLRTAALKGNGTEEPASTSQTSIKTHASSLGTENTSDGSATHPYQLRLRKKVLCDSTEELTTDSDDNSGSDHTATRAQHRTRRVPESPDVELKRPAILPEELDIVRRSILHTILPSWINRVPHNLGEPSHGSLKAAEWLILYKLYYPISLIPVWTNSLEEAGSDKRKNRLSSLLDSTTLLCKIAHFLTLPKIKLDDLNELESLITDYRKVLQKNWPGLRSKPNLHLTQHYPEDIRRFGPPRSTAAWAQERVNGMLQKLPTNHHMGQFCFFFPLCLR